MSDSESSITTPSDAALRDALRHAVADVYKSGNLEELTVRRVRAAAETHLGLPSGFFKDDAQWKSESDRVIKEETDAQEAGLKSSPAAKPKTRIVKKTQSETTKKRTRQDPPGDKARPRKRQRTATPAESGSEESSLSSVDEAVGEDSVDERPSTDTKKAPEEPNKGHKAESIPKANDKKPAIESQSEPDGEDGPVSVPSKANGEPQDAGSESEMSEVLDKAPPPKKKGRKVSDTSRKDKKPAKSKPKEDSNLNPQEAEIKRLQSWLLKCGIRKLWHKELAPYPSPKAKINHLKSMLKEAGMDGRYSAEKAKQIREERELQAELEAVQEGAKHWGQPEVDEDDVKRPKRRLAKGLRELDFLADEDGEETE